MMNKLHTFGLTLSAIAVLALLIKSIYLGNPWKSDIELFLLFVSASVFFLLLILKQKKKRAKNPIDK